MKAILTICSRAILVDSGTTTFDGTAQQTVARYLSSEDVRLSSEFVPSGQTPSLSISRISLLVDNQHGNATPVVGQSIGIQVEYESLAPIAFLGVGIVIYDHRGDPILNTNNSYQQMAALRSPSCSGTVRCDLGLVPLMPGKYSVSVWLGDEVAHDHVFPDALCFELLARNIWGTGARMPPTISNFWWPTEYSISHNDRQRSSPT